MKSYRSAFWATAVLCLLLACGMAFLLWRWHAERGLKVVTIGGVTRIRESDLQAFLKRHETEAHSAEVEKVQNAG